MVPHQFGWLLPLVLAPICFVGVTAGLPVIKEAPVLLLFIGAVVVGVFEAFYGGLWAGRLPWMVGTGVIWRTALWTVALWLLAVSLFAPVTASAYKQHVFDVDSGVGAPTASMPSLSWDFAALYLWHLFDAIPGLEMTKTLRWDEPVGHDEMELGAGVVAYRAAVLLPLLASLRGIVETRRVATRCNAADPQMSAQRSHPQAS